MHRMHKIKAVRLYGSGLTIKQVQQEMPGVPKTHIKKLLRSTGMTKKRQEEGGVHGNEPEPEEIARRAEEIRKQWTQEIECRRWVGRYVEKTVRAQEVAMPMKQNKAFSP